MSDKAFLAWLKAHAGQYDFDTYAAQAYNAWNLRSDRATGECFGDLPAHEQAACMPPRRTAFITHYSAGNR